ncbi:hypothetical protein QOZ96_001231 [Brevundimonas nasdae]|uniref:hypothetical protein n=1 Tax=Brevundimonas nasdae TaxID=172043 RepID=UPI001912D9D0|nr:hypothetical protein [Brevundimonas nasdae]MBK6024748.1 hypothetical protein [Brevundimonas nasdae]MDQ0451288.1 hypothetical protein [Brevundimonas nasdae]
MAAKVTPEFRLRQGLGGADEFRDSFCGVMVSVLAFVRRRANAGCSGDANRTPDPKSAQAGMKITPAE